MPTKEDSPKDPDDLDAYFREVVALARKDPAFFSLQKTPKGLVFGIIDATRRTVHVLVPWTRLREIRAPYQLAPRDILSPRAAA